MVDRIGLLWLASAVHLLFIVIQRRLGGRLTGAYTLYLFGIASTYWIGMTLRHYKIGPVFIRDHLPDVGFVVWQSLTILTYATVFLMMCRHPPARAVFLKRILYTLGVSWVLVFIVTLLFEVTGSFDWVDVGAYVVGIAFATIPLSRVIQSMRRDMA